MKPRKNWRAIAIGLTHDLQRMQVRAEKAEALANYRDYPARQWEALVQRILDERGPRD